MEPKHKDFKFENQAGFIAWLKETASNKITFRDRGQDLLEIWTDKDGEIVNCNAQSSIWNGAFVDLKKLKLKSEITMFLRGKWQTTDFVIIKNEILR